jgi:hypothetical protein
MTQEEIKAIVPGVEGDIYIYNKYHNMLNLNIPSFKALVRKSYFTKNKEDNNEFYNVYVFGIQSVSGVILTFHVMTDTGMVRSRIPISEIYTKIPTNDIPFNFKQLWDCFSENAAVTEYNFLAHHRAQVVLRDGTKVWGTYMFTIDWFNNPYSDEPTDYKCGHIFESDEGYLMCMPNNRIFWKDSNWVTKKLPEDLKQYKVDTELPSVENQSDKWITEDGDSFYYDMNETYI